MKIILGTLTFLFGSVMLSQEVKTFNSYETLEDVKSIEIHNDLCVILYPTYFYGVQIKGDNRLKDIIKWDFKNSVLKLYTTEENILTSYAEITLYVKGFEELRLSGNASAQTDVKMITESFALFSSGNSTYNFPIECKDFSLIIDGESSGYLDLSAVSLRIQAINAATTYIKYQGNKVTVEQSDNSIVGMRGKAQSLSATIDKNAQLKAWALKAEDVYLLSSNKGDINVYAANRLKINGQGTAKIFVTGSPQQIDTININKKTRIFYRAQ